MRTTSSKRLGRIGLFGGTFDPVHNGHLIAAQDFQEGLELDAVIWIPCRQSPHKKGKAVTAPKHRLEMLRGALEPYLRFWVSTCELERRGLSYAIDTVRQMRELFSGAELFWLLGEDQLEGLSSWKDFSRLKDSVKFAVASRPCEMPLSQQTRKKLGVISLPCSRQIDISASEIRERVKENKTIRPFVTQTVADYLQESGLYRGRGKA